MIDAFERASLVALDTCALIYFIEANADYLPLVKPLFEAIDNGSKRGVSSYIALLEVLVKPLKNQRQDLAEKYRDALLNSTGLNLYAIDDEVAEEAAQIRAAYSFKTPDSIQLAVATMKSADLFVTNDALLKRFDGLEVVVLREHLSMPN